MPPAELGPFVTARGTVCDVAEVSGKGALDCSKRQVTIAVLSIGGPKA